MFFFAIQNLVDIQSSRFRLYSQKANYKWRSYQADRPLVSLAAILFLRKFVFVFGFIISSWTVYELWWWTVYKLLFLNSSWLFINFCSWTRRFNFLRTVCELFMNYFWVHNKFLNWWWTVHERLFMWTFQELLMNCSWTIFVHNKFLNSSWTVMVNCSWTLVHEPTMRVFYELLMNYSWMFMNGS